MGFGDTEIKDAVISKLDKWLDNPPDFHEVSEAYHYRGEMQAQRIKLVRQIESIEDDIVSDEENKPRANSTRIKKLQATKALKDHLALLDAAIAETENMVKWMEFQKTMFNAANFHTKIRMDL